MRWIRGTVVRVARPDEPGLLHADGRMLPYALDSGHANSDRLCLDMAVEFAGRADGSAVGVHSLVNGSLSGVAALAASADTAADPRQSATGGREDPAPGSRAARTRRS